MASYKDMYHTLFNKITDIIEELEEVQARTESMYIEAQPLRLEKRKEPPLE